jgi:hypothetical protein
MDETTTQSEIRDFNNVLESRRSEVDFLVDYSEPFYDWTDDGGL